MCKCINCLISKDPAWGYAPCLNAKKPTQEPPKKP